MCVGLVDDWLYGEGNLRQSSGGLCDNGRKGGVGGGDGRLELDFVWAPENMNEMLKYRKLYEVGMTVV